MIITCPELLPTLLEVSANRKIPTSAIYLLEPTAFDIGALTSPSPPTSNGHAPNRHHSNDEAVASFESLLTHGEEDWDRFSDEKTAKETAGVQFTTSGTTGLPKLAVLSHFALIANLTTVMQDVPYEVARLMALPFFLIYGFLYGHVPAVRFGEPLYILPRFRPVQYVEAIQKYSITDAYMAPLIVNVLQQSSLPLRDLLHSLRFVVIGGGQLTVTAQEEFCSHLHLDCCITHGWGMTETGPITLFRWGDRDTTESVGYVLEGTELKLLDAQGKIVTADSQPGEAFVRSQAMLSYYITSECKTVSPLDEDGWLRTGDIMSKKDGKYYFIGRGKDLIKVKG